MVTNFYYLILCVVRVFNPNVSSSRRFPTEIDLQAPTFEIEVAQLQKILFSQTFTF